MRNKSKSNFQTWLLENRIRVFLWAFLITIPTALILLAYVGTYSNNKKIYFDETKTKDTIIVKNFETLDSSKYLDFSIEWEELQYPQLINGEYLYGNYVFYISYKTKLNYNITSVKVTPLLNTNWVNTKSLGSEIDITNSTRRMQIPYNHVLPKKPLLFVTVNEPDLYLKVDLKIDFGQTKSEITIYVKHSLKNENPNMIY